ncbi:MAG: CCDC90 family protein [Deltaproteobacteria bacterium]|jgi:hypothetical protein|nr:CCDC90 family protein [Deltaproteobacteria bacterium]
MLLFDDSKKLEKAIGEEAAAVIAHVFEQADVKWRQELATKADLMETKMELRSEIAAVRVEMQAMKNELIKWMMGGFVALGGFLLAAMAFFK